MRKKLKVRPDGIIAWKPDRLARNMRDAGELIELLDSGVLSDLKFVMYSFHNDSSGKEHLAMEFARAKAYSDHLQDNVLRGTIEQEMKGRATRPLPPAFTMVEDEKSDDYLKIIPSKFHEHWRNAFRWKLEDNTNDEIAALLRKDGYRDKKEYKTKKGRKVINVRIDGDYVGRHLKNPLHCGWLVAGEDSKEPRRADLNELYPHEFGEPFPVVVTLEDFKRVNPDLFSDTAGTPRTGRRTDYPLSGKVLCKLLHDRKQLATMTATSPKGGSGIPSPRFMCQRCTPQHSVNMPALFAAVGEKLKDVKLTEREHKILVVTEWVKYERERESEDTELRQIAALKGTNKQEITDTREELRTRT
jgi:DNA invertase Pin-like site-specific DNA recombinase